MKSWHMSLGAGLEGLVLRHHEIPRPGPREVLVRVHAVSRTSRGGWILRWGGYPLPGRAEGIGMCAGAGRVGALGGDGRGEVAALGEGVTRVRTGDRVIASIFPYWMDGPFSLERSTQLGGTLDGMLTEYAVLPEEALVGVPAYLSDDEAATLPCVAAT